MKKAIAIIVLGLLFCNVGFAEEIMYLKCELIDSNRPELARKFRISKCIFITILKFLYKYKLQIVSKISQLLARPGGFEPPTLGLEMRGVMITNFSELRRFVNL